MKLGFKQSNGQSEESKIGKESIEDNAVVNVQSHLINQRLAYTSTLDISYVGWISEHISEDDILPYVGKFSNYDNNYVKDTLVAVAEAISHDLPADYVPQEAAISTSSDKIEVDVL